MKKLYTALGIIVLAALAAFALSRTGYTRFYEVFPEVAEGEEVILVEIDDADRGLQAALWGKRAVTDFLNGLELRPLKQTETDETAEIRLLLRYKRGETIELAVVKLYKSGLMFISREAGEGRDERYFKMKKPADTDGLRALFSDWSELEAWKVRGHVMEPPRETHFTELYPITAEDRRYFTNGFSLEDRTAHLEGRGTDLAALLEWLDGLKLMPAEPDRYNEEADLFLFCNVKEFSGGVSPHVSFAVGFHGSEFISVQTGGFSSRPADGAFDSAYYRLTEPADFDSLKALFSDWKPY